MKGSRWEYDQEASMGLGLYRILHFKTSKLGLGSVGDDKVVVDLGEKSGKSEVQRRRSLPEVCVLNQGGRGLTM